MKKREAIVFMASIMLLGAACGTPKETEIAKLYAQGFAPNVSVANDSGYHALFTNVDQPDKVYRIDALLTSEQREKIDDLFFEDEEVIKKYLCTLEQMTVKDYSEYLPAQSELDSYKGMTLQELENLGYEYSGYAGDEEEIEFFYDGATYCMRVYPEQNDKLKSFDEENMDEVLDLAIDHVEFLSLSDRVLEN